MGPAATLIAGAAGAWTSRAQTPPDVAGLIVAGPAPGSNDIAACSMAARQTRITRIARSAASAFCAGCCCTRLDGVWGARRHGPLARPHGSGRRPAASGSLVSGAVSVLGNSARGGRRRVYLPQARPAGRPPRARQLSSFAACSAAALGEAGWARRLRFSRSAAPPRWSPGSVPLSALWRPGGARGARSRRPLRPPRSNLKLQQLAPPWRTGLSQTHSSCRNPPS
jgi:hypothetical protein